MKSTVDYVRNFSIFIVRQLSAPGESPVLPMVRIYCGYCLEKSLGDRLCFRRKYAGVAQLVEQLICNQQVIGSSPIASSEKTWLRFELLRELEPMY